MSVGSAAGERVLADWGGSGPLIVLVHGDSPVAELTWLGQRALRSDSRVQVLKRRGFGMRASLPIDAGRDADDLLAHLTGPAHLVGHSHGGVVALLAAARRPAVVRSVTVVEPPLFQFADDRVDVRQLLSRVEALLAGELDGSSATAVSELLSNTGDVPADPRFERLCRKFAAGVRPWHHPVGELVGAQCPVSVVCGGWSAAYTAVCDRLAARLHGYRLTVHGHGHFPHHARQRFNGHVLRTLSGVGEQLAGVTHRGVLWLAK
ncbi:MAG: alpha/beta fold hydrolase [Thermocrispum sp.]